MAVPRWTRAAAGDSLGTMIATALDAPPDILDADERRFVERIRVHGWFGTHVFADDEGPGFSFTTGIYVGLEQPEVLVFSLGQERAQAVLWDVWRTCLQGPLPVAEVLPAGRIFANTAAWLMPVAKHRYPEHLGWSRWFYGGDAFPCLQLVWPDAAGRFPWEAAFDLRHRESQPDLSAGSWGRS